MRALSELKMHGQETPPGAQKLERAALTARLAAALDRKVVLLRAPAGYGKTSALHSCRTALHNAGRLVVWCSCAAGDGDPGRFAAGLAQACARAGVMIDDDGGGVFGSVENNGSAENRIVAIAQALREHPLPAVVVIDEFHNAAGEATEHFLKVLIQRLGPDDCVVIAARAEPACGAAKLRLDGRIAEFGRADLAFCRDEIAALFEFRLSDEDVAWLAEKTGGWPAALGFAKMRFGGDPGGADAGATIRDFAGDLPDIAGYLADEILGDLPEDLRAFACKTAIFPDFTAGAANYVLQRNDAEPMMARLETGFALLSPAGPEGDRFAYNPVLRDYLRTALRETFAPDEVFDLYARASDYYRDRGAFLPAVEFAMESRDDERLSALVDRAGPSTLQFTTDYARFHKVMQEIDRRLDNVAPHIQPLLAYFLIKRGAIRKAGAVLGAGREERARAQEGPGAAAGAQSGGLEYFLVDAVYAVYRDERQTAELIAELEETRHRKGAADDTYLGVVNNALGMLLLRHGRLAEADAAFAEAVRMFSKAGSEFSVVYNTLHRGSLALLRADGDGAQAYIDSAERLHADSRSMPRTLALVVAIERVKLLYEQGRLAAAFEIAPAARADLVKGGDYWVELLAPAFRIEARHEYMRSGLAAALGVFGQGIELARREKLARLEKSLWAGKLHLAAAAGETGAASQILAEMIEDVGAMTRDGVVIGRESGRRRFGWREDIECQCAMVRLAIAEDDGAGALAGLERLGRLYLPPEADLIRLKIRALRALALFVNGDSQDAANALLEVLQEGRRRNLSSFFLEEGAQAQALLDEAARRFSKNKKAEVFNRFILEWLIDANDFAPRATSPAPEITRQQQAMLELLGLGLDRREIAERTGTTVHNVQYHLNKLFETFGVSNSVRLTAEAVRFGLIARPGALPASPGEQL